MKLLNRSLLKKLELKCLLMVPIFSLVSIFQCFAQVDSNSVNLLLNSNFDFHSFQNHRFGEPKSFSSHNVAFWNTSEWGDIETIRESHVSDAIRPKFSTHNMVAIYPGKKLWQFFTLPEAGLAHGDELMLSVHGYQRKGNQIKAKVKIMKLDSEDGKWSPQDFGMTDKRTFPRHSRGELVVADEYVGVDEKEGSTYIDIKDVVINGKISKGDISNSKDINAIGIQVEFENVAATDTVWVYAPKLSRTAPNTVGPPEPRKMNSYYKHIPRTIQKLWKGEPIHIIVMGSSIDVGSANPPMYLYDENASSGSFKTPVAEGLFDSEKVNRPDLDGYFGEWRHYFTYSGRLKRELMRKFNLRSDQICLNFMAIGGSSIGEAHSGLKEYCSLSIPPGPGSNGHKEGSTWEELYPELFARNEGPRPDLVIFGSGANEKTDTPDEVAVFEGSIRYIQQHYPNTEFLFCQFQNYGGYTPSPGDMQALSLRYQIPYIDYGKIGDDLVRWTNKYAFVPSDGHPQAAAHYVWFKQIEKAFETWNPIETGQAQLQLPERLHENTYGWEGEMVAFDSTSTRIRGNKFIFEDNAINCWGKVDSEPPIPYIDGIEFSSRRSSPTRNLRNSMFRHGRTRLGDRHILEIKGDNPVLTYVDSKINPNRRFFPMDNPNWNINGINTEEFVSEWGAPYGSKMMTLKPGKYLEIDVLGTDLSIAYVDNPHGGILDVYIDGELKLSQPSNVGFVDIDRKTNFLENRKGILNLGYGMHKVRLEAKNSAVKVLGVFSYDVRPNRDAERRVTGLASGGEVLEFSLPFKARPFVICGGGLSVETEDISKSSVKFSGGSGSFEIIGE
ncbi:hypothetical protein [Kriegella aquimaris]|uniref:Uncharacterized protein n=1 Tax=Kriegella aquimaris TaxID=192904 RepID=A0A1G9VHS8_9FLAO|nr:hypothetical protein [Kriegella aquimaris]SDM71627.1 hypothetical protein SAMN04488514_11389 [Kriegella aquimaris]